MPKWDLKSFRGTQFHDHQWFKNVGCHTHIFLILHSFFINHICERFEILSWIEFRITSKQLFINEAPAPYSISCGCTHYNINFQWKLARYNDRKHRDFNFMQVRSKAMTVKNTGALHFSPVMKSKHCFQLFLVFIDSDALDGWNKNFPFRILSSKWVRHLIFAGKILWFVMLNIMVQSNHSVNSSSSLWFRKIQNY